MVLKLLKQGELPLKKTGHLSSTGLKQTQKPSDFSLFTHEKSQNVS